MEYHFNTLPNFGVLEVKLEQKHIDLLLKKQHIRVMNLMAIQ